MVMCGSNVARKRNFPSERQSEAYRGPSFRNKVKIVICLKLKKEIGEFYVAELVVHCLTPH